MAAHTIAQEVFSSHLSSRAEQSSSTAKNNGHSQQGSAAAGGLQDELYKDRSAAAGNPPKPAVGDSEVAVEVADRVLQESRAEADAALQYAHKVSTTSFTRNKHSTAAYRPCTVLHEGNDRAGNSNRIAPPLA